MDNSKIHEGLDKKELRDFIALTFVKNFDEYCAIPNPQVVYDKNNPLEYNIKRLELEIAIKQEELRLAKEKNATYQIMLMNGWQDFDVSDETKNTSKYKLHMNFIGTEEEYNKFMKNEQLFSNQK